MQKEETLLCLSCKNIEICKYKEHFMESEQDIKSEVEKFNLIIRKDNNREDGFGCFFDMMKINITCSNYLNSYIPFFRTFEQDDKEILFGDGTKVTCNSKE